MTESLSLFSALLVCVSIVAGVPRSLPMIDRRNAFSVILSGLDSFMAEAVVTKLKVLAEAGRTIVATIHQPSSHVSETETL